MRWLMILYASTALACTAESPTGIDLTISYPGNMAADSLLIRAHVAGERAFEPGIVPEVPRELAPGGENLIIVLPSKLADNIIDIRVDAFKGGEVLRSGRVSLQLIPNTLVSARVYLDGFAICGDGDRAAMLEDCDDGNEVDGDGCSADCFIEQGWSCTGVPSACQPCMTDFMCSNGRGYCELECPSSACICMLSCGDGSRRCSADCSGSDQCQLDCGTSGRCDAQCRGEGSRCDIECADTDRCEATCSEGSTCTIACTDGAPCKVECRDHATCLLECGDASTCELERCDDGAVSCPDNIIVCNRACP